MAEQEAAERTNDIPLLPIRVGGALLAVSALAVAEVVDDAEPLFLPRAPAHVPGLLNLRGTALPLLDVARFLGLPSSPGDSAFPRIVVVEAAEMTVGLRCSAVLGVVPAQQCASRPAGEHEGVLGEIAVAEVDLPGGLGTQVDLVGLLERARVRQ